MIVTLDPVNIKLPDTPRTPGVHLSSIIRCIAQETGILKTELLEDISLTDFRTITDTVALLRISIGLAWEQYYIPTIADVVDHPDEMQVDNILMNCDGESVTVIVTQRRKGIILHVHEIKATYKSTRTVGLFENQWMWMAQLKAYCRAKRTRHGKMHVLFLCGDYKWPIRPMLKIFDVEFTQQELDENWDLMVDYMKYRLDIELQEKLEDWYGTACDPKTA